MKKTLIFGTNTLSELLLYHLGRTDKIYPEAFIVSDPRYLQSDTFQSLPVVDFEHAKQLYPSSEYGVYVCVGYSDMNRNREKIYSMLQQAGYEILSYIHPSAQIECKELGVGTLVFQNVVIDAYSHVGSGNIFSLNTSIGHHCFLGNFNYFASCVCVSGCVSIENNCFLGAHSTLKNGIKIADYTLIGAGAYVSKSTDREALLLPPKCEMIKRKSFFVEP